jgi:hypothetical protein
MWHPLHENAEIDDLQKQLEVSLPFSIIVKLNDIFYDIDYFFKKIKINRSIMVKDTTKATKLEKKLNITLAGYLVIIIIVYYFFNFIHLLIIHL